MGTEKKQSSNLMTYEPWQPDAAIGAKEAVAAASESGGFWKPKAGTNRIRILPTLRGIHLAPLVETWNHYIEMPGEEKGVGFNCPRKMKAGWPCPACLKVDELRASKNPADYEAAGKFLPKLRVYVNMIDRNDEAAGVQKFAFGKTIYEPLMSYRSRNEDEDEPFTNIDDTGCDIILDKEGEKKKTKYAVRLAKKHTPLHLDATVAQEWMEAINDLRPEAIVLSMKDIRAKLAGDDRDDDDRGGRRGGGGAPARGGSRRVTDDMDDTGDDKEGYQLHPDD